MLCDLSRLLLRDRLRLRALHTHNQPDRQQPTGRAPIRSQAERVRRFGARARGVGMTAQFGTARWRPCRARCRATRDAGACWLRDTVPRGMPWQAVLRCAVRPSALFCTTVQRPALRRSLAVAQATMSRGISCHVQCHVMRDDLRCDDRLLSRGPLHSPTPAERSGRNCAQHPPRAVDGSWASDDVQWVPWKHAPRHAAARAWRHAALRSEQGKGCAWWRWRRRGGVSVCV